MIEKRIKKARRQLRDTYRYLDSPNMPELRNTSGSVVAFNRTAKRIPLIIFDNKTLVQYARISQGHTSGFLINCFSLQDFITMLRTLWVPSEIIEYTQFRIHCQNTIDTAESVLLHAYLYDKYGIVSNAIFPRQALIAFNQVISETKNRTINSPDSLQYIEILKVFARFSRMEISYYIDRLKLAHEDALQNVFEYSHFLVSPDRSYGVVFASVTPETNHRLALICEMFKYEFKLPTAICVGIYREDTKSIRMDYLYLCGEWEYDKELAELCFELGRWSSRTYTSNKLWAKHRID